MMVFDLLWRSLSKSRRLAAVSLSAAIGLLGLAPGLYAAFWFTPDTPDPETMTLVAAAGLAVILGEASFRRLRRRLMTAATRAATAEFDAKVLGRVTSRSRALPFLATLAETRSAAQAVDLFDLPLALLSMAAVWWISPLVAGMTLTVMLTLAGLSFLAGGKGGDRVPAVSKKILSVLGIVIVSLALPAIDSSLSWAASIGAGLLISRSLMVTLTTLPLMHKGPQLAIAMEGIIDLLKGSPPPAMTGEEACPNTEGVMSLGDADFLERKSFLDQGKPQDQGYLLPDTREPKAIPAPDLSPPEVAAAAGESVCRPSSEKEENAAPSFVSVGLADDGSAGNCEPPPAPSPARRQTAAAKNAPTTAATKAKKAKKDAVAKTSLRLETYRPIKKPPRRQTPD